MGIANIIVVDKLTGASRAVLDRPALITNVELLSAAGTTEGEKANGDAERSIIYAIVDRDTDGDSALTARDEAGCYISDLAGNGLHRINDPGSSLRIWYIDGRSIYLRVVVDGDHDGSFDNDDREERILRYDMGGQGTASRIVSDSLATAMIAIAKKPMR